MDIRLWFQASEEFGSEFKLVFLAQTQELIPEFLNSFFLVRYLENLIFICRNLFQDIFEQFECQNE